MIIAKSKIPQTHNRTAELKIGVKAGDRRITVKHRARDDGPADLDMTSPARKPEEKIYSLLAPGVAASVGRRLLARRCHNIIASSSSSLSIHTLNGLKPPTPSGHDGNLREEFVLSHRGTCILRLGTGVGHFPFHFQWKC